MRIVYDASARVSSEALSLNDCLHTGPNLMQDLTGILLKFRTHRVAFTADIEKAFLQIELNNQDRDATRFLWLKDTNKSVNSADNLEAYRFCRVLFGAAPSPFLLNATIQYHLNENDNWIMKDLTENMYMDNVVTGTNCHDKALEYYSLSQNYLQKAGMNLRQWTSNSIALNRRAQDDNAHAAQTTKILGLTWNSTNDTLSLSLENMIKKSEAITKLTKRSTISFASKLFDPLGYVEPITVKAKIMIQDLWKQNLSWDEDVPSDHENQWLNWISDISNLTSIEIPRPYFLTDISTRQLHIFCDSSQLAYGAVAYLRGKSGAEVYTAFVMAKTKVAPIKTQTLPRLELLAALLGAQLSEYLTKTLQLTKTKCEVTYWSDSHIVLSWISSTKQLPQFVSTRVHKIKEITSPNTWQFCPTSMNPADLLTRGLDTKMFNEKKQLWFQGPPWLRNPEDTWPPQPEPSSIHTEYENPQLAVTIMADIKENPNILNIIELTKYSTLTRVVRITALLVLFARKWKTPEGYNDNILTTKEMLEARNLLLKATQQITYQKEISYLKNGDKFKEPAIVRQLNLYLDDEDLLRCRGRLQYTDLPHDTKFPILMPKDNYLTSLIVQSMHKTVMHGGVCETLTQLRQTYWIPQGRQLVKRIISKCTTCRKI